MYIVISNAKSLEMKESVIVSEDAFSKAVDFFKKEGLDIFANIFDTYLDAFKFKRANDFDLVRSPVFYDIYLFEHMLGCHFGEPDMFIKENIRFGYEISINSVNSLIDFSEKNNAIVDRGIDVYVYANGDDVGTCEKAYAVINIDSIKGFDLDFLIHSSVTPDYSMYSIIDVDTNDGLLTIKSFNKIFYELEDSLVLKKGRPVNFNFKNELFFKKIAGEFV